MTTTKLPEYDGTADLRAYGEACRATAPAEVAGDGVERALYDSLAAADNQDLPLEEYPARILKVMAEHSDLTLARELRWLANDKHATDEQRAIASRAIAALATRPAPGRDGFVMVPRLSYNHPGLSAHLMKWLDCGEEYAEERWQEILKAAAPAPRSNDNG